MVMKKPIKKAPPKETPEYKAYKDSYSKTSAYESMKAKGSPSAGTRSSRPSLPNALKYPSWSNFGHDRAIKEVENAKGRRRNQIGGGFGATKLPTPAAAAAGKAAKQRGQRIKKAAPKKVAVK